MSLYIIVPGYIWKLMAMRDLNETLGMEDFPIMFIGDLYRVKEAH
jgi:hypothetical protein